MSNLRNKAALSVLLMVSLGHLLNDMFQAVIPAIYPIIKESLGLSFMQIGAITLTNQITSSLLQPMVGYFSDKHQVCIPVDSVPATFRHRHLLPSEY